MIHFTKSTIQDAVGEVIASSTHCRQLRTKGIAYRFICKIYDKNSNMVAEYTTIQKGVFKAISKEMHKLRKGSLECICNPHHKLR